MKLLTLLLGILSFVALGVAVPPDSSVVSERPTSILPTLSPRTGPNPPSFTSATPTKQATPTNPTTIPYTARVACDTIITTRAPCRTVTSHCVFPASTTTPYTVLLNGTTTSGLVCVPTAYLSTSWAPHKTRTWWKVRAQATGTVQASNSSRAWMEAQVPPPEWFATRSPSWRCKPPFCFGRLARTGTGVPGSTRIAGIPPPEWFSTRFPGGCVGTTCPTGVATPTRTRVSTAMSG